jgi:hypothetical protein
MTKVRCNLACKYNSNNICKNKKINLEELPYEGLFCTSWEMQE